MSGRLDREVVKSKIRALIESELNIAVRSDDDDLVGTDTLDSYTMMLLLAFIKKEFRVDINMEKIDFDAFGSLNTMADMVQNPPK